MKFRKLISSVAMASVTFGVAATSFAQAGATTYKMDHTVNWTKTV